MSVVTSVMVAAVGVGVAGVLAPSLTVWAAAGGAWVGLVIVVAWILSRHVSPTGLGGQPLSAGDLMQDSSGEWVAYLSPGGRVATAVVVLGYVGVWWSVLTWARPGSGWSVVDVVAWLGLVGLLLAVALPTFAVRVAAPMWFSRHVVGVVAGQWRLAVRYRRLWRAGMIGAGLVTRYHGVDYLPVITSAVATGNVDHLRVRLLHGQTTEDFTEATEKLRHTFGVHRVAVAETGSGRITLTFFRRDPLRAEVPALPIPSSLDLTALPVARVEDGTTYALRLLGTHVLIVGASGSGKGSALWSIIRALSPGVASGQVRLVGIDPKRMELVFARGLFSELQEREPASMVDLLERLVAQIPMQSLKGRREPDLDRGFHTAGKAARRQQ
jgi:hypothetical protein